MNSERLLLTSSRPFVKDRVWHIAAIYFHFLDIVSISLNLISFMLDPDFFNQYAQVLCASGILFSNSRRSLQFGINLSMWARKRSLWFRSSK